jgi:hypothetical protein
VTGASASVAGSVGIGSISTMRRPPRVASIRTSTSAPAVAGSQQRRDVGAERVGVQRQPQPGGGALKAREMLVERVGHAAVEPHHLEGAVTAQQTEIGDRDDRRAASRSCPSMQASSGSIAPHATRSDG